MENKLRQAYINKELYAQLCERRKKEKIREEQVSQLVIRFGLIFSEKCHYTVLRFEHLLQ